MVKTNALANASALMAAVIYFVCVVLVAIAPDLAFNFFALTFHGVNVEPLRPVIIDIGVVNTLVGALLWTGLIWITVYGVVYFYNGFVKRK